MDYENISYDPALDKYGLLDLYVPDCPNPCPILIYIHGGGLESGDKAFGAEDLAVIRKLNVHGIAVASLNYRLYPSAKFPEFIEDCAKAADWVVHRSGRYGKFTDCYIGGSSAGGYISMMLCFDGRYLGRYGIRPSDVKGYLFDAGQPTVHFNVLRERELDTRLVRADEAAPIYFVDKDYDKTGDLPDLLFFVSDHDISNRLEQTRMFVRALLDFHYDPDRISFHIVKDSTHCSYFALPEFSDGIISMIQSRSLTAAV